MNNRKLGFLVLMSMLGLAAIASARPRQNLFNSKNLTPGQRAQIRKLNVERKAKVVQVKSTKTVARASMSVADQKTERDRIRQEVTKINADYGARMQKIVNNQ